MRNSTQLHNEKETFMCLQFDFIPLIGTESLQAFRRQESGLKGLSVHVHLNSIITDRTDSKIV